MSGRNSAVTRRPPAAAALALVLAIAAPVRAAGFPDAAAGPGAARARALMGTLCTVRIEAPRASDSAAATLAAHALDEIARLEPVLSSWDPASELKSLNARAAKAPTPCSRDLFDAVVRGIELAGTTGGAFDPTIEPLLVAWDVRGRGRVPDDEARASARARVGHRNVACDAGNRTVSFLREGTALDLGGIGKGFALDRALRAIEAEDAMRDGRALLNLGGEILARSPGDPWTIDLAHPSDRLRAVARVSVTNGAVSTSAQAERTLLAGRRRIGHVLDPRSGEPVATVASVTVVATDATTADALSTALLVMGRDEAARFAASHPEVGVVWLEPSGSGVRGWRWNQEARSIAEDAVRWMDESPATRSRSPEPEGRASAP